MSYELKISATTLAELKGKISALHAEFIAAHDPVMPEVRDTIAGNKPIVWSESDPAAEDIKPAKVTKPKAEPKVEPKAEVVEEPKPEPETEVAEIDFDKDIIPRVTDVVKRCGREKMQEILAGFNVAKASQVPAEQRGELKAAMDEALSA